MVSGSLSDLEQAGCESAGPAHIPPLSRAMAPSMALRHRQNPSPAGEFFASASWVRQTSGHADPLGMGRVIPPGIKSIKYFIDSRFRPKIVPAPGSVLYCDLSDEVERSGIYVGDGVIANLLEDGLTQGQVRLSSPRVFSSGGTAGRMIYVSCDEEGAAGRSAVAHRAAAYVGETPLHGLLIKNSHHFLIHCVNHSGPEFSGDSLIDSVLARGPGAPRTPSLADVKALAGHALGATKWLLWDWEGKVDGDQTPWIDWSAHSDFFARMPLNEKNVLRIRAELAEVRDYEVEISGEAIPGAIRAKLAEFREGLESALISHDDLMGFIDKKVCSSFSHAVVEKFRDELRAFDEVMRGHQGVRRLLRRLGRDYVLADRKKRAMIHEASRVDACVMRHGDDVGRILPGELLNLRDEATEILFYARLLEGGLLACELQGVLPGTHPEAAGTGPVVACLAISSDMAGGSLLKAKALLLAIAHAVQDEGRSLHVLLSGASGEVMEFSMTARNETPGLLDFFQVDPGRGADHESLLGRALDIVGSRPSRMKGDILMISYDRFVLSPEFEERAKARKRALGCTVYSVLCHGARGGDGVSDEVVAL